MSALLPVDPAAAIEVWDNALCSEVDPELWFPEKGGNQGTLAKQICARCAVRELCLETFGPIIPYGVVGGLSERERRAHWRETSKTGEGDAA